MAKIVLHIGTHKTASTTIQDMFTANAALLAHYGLIYPQLSRGISGHHGLVTDWNPLPERYHLPMGSLANLGKIAASYGTGGQTVFLSSEEFSRGDPGARVDFKALRAALAPFERIEVVCLLREQWHFMQSVYLEVSKTRNPGPVEPYLRQALETRMIEGLWIDYTLLYDHLLGAFAPDEIFFYNYDLWRLSEGGILGGMMGHLGLNLPLQDLVQVNGGHSNRSPASLPQWAANMVAHPFPAPDWLLEACAHAFDVEYGSGRESVIWHRAEMAALQDLAQDCNSRLCQRLAGVQSDFTMQNSAFTPQTVFRDDITLDFWRRVARWSYRAKAG